MYLVFVSWLRTFFLVGCVAYNLGTGRGTSVLEMVAAFKKASGKVYPCTDRAPLIRRKGPETTFLAAKLQEIPTKFCPRRPGDATEVYASTEKAARELGWR